MTIIEIEAKKTVLTSTRQDEINKANLELAPLQGQMAQLETRAHQIQLGVTERVSRIDGQLALLEELLVELRPPAPVATDTPGVGSTDAATPDSSREVQSEEIPA